MPEARMKRLEEIIMKNCSDCIGDFEKGLRKRARIDISDAEAEKALTESRIEYLVSVKRCVHADVFSEFSYAFEKYDSLLKEETNSEEGSSEAIWAGQLYRAACQAVTGNEPDVKTIIILNNYQADLMQKTLRDLDSKSSASSSVGQAKAGNGYVVQSVQSEVREEQDKTHNNRGWLIASCVLGVLLIAAIGLSGWLFYSNLNLTYNLAVTESKLRKTEEERDEYSSVYKQKVEEVNGLKDKVKDYQDSYVDAWKIYNDMINYDYGEFALDFFSASRIFVLQEGKVEWIDVYFDHPGKTAYYTADNRNINGEWFQGQEQDVIRLKVTAVKKGTTTITFTNDVNDETFKVLAVIIPKKE